MIIKLIDIAICSGLYFFGGYAWHNSRRFIMPIFLVLGISYASHAWWLGLTCLPVIGIFCTGYGEKSVLWKYFNDFWTRFIWMFMAALVIAGGACATGHLHWYIYLPYCVISGFLGASLRNINEIVGDLIFGAWLSSVILFIR